MTPRNAADLARTTYTNNIEIKADRAAHAALLNAASLAAQNGDETTERLLLGYANRYDPARVSADRAQQAWIAAGGDQMMALLDA